MKVKSTLEVGHLKVIADNLGFKLDNLRTEGRYIAFVLRMRDNLPHACGSESTNGNGFTCTRPMHHEGRCWFRDDQQKIHDAWYGTSPHIRYRKHGFSRIAWGKGMHYAGAAVCWHGHREFYREIFKLDPEAVIVTKFARYVGTENFEEKFNATGTVNMGSQMCPISFAEMCDC